MSTLYTNNVFYKSVSTPSSIVMSSMGSNEVIIQLHGATVVLDLINIVFKTMSEDTTDVKVSIIFVEYGIQTF
jgi:hypothetical protein